jgi:hypothetical protein
MNGNVLTQITSLKAAWNGGQNRVDLLNEGLSGFTPGSGEVTIDIGFAVPIGGLEEDFTGAVSRGDYVSMQVFLGPKDYVGTGKLLTCDIGQSVNAAVEGNAQWMGTLAPLQ